MKWTSLVLTQNQQYRVSVEHVSPIKHVLTITVKHDTAPCNTWLTIAEATYNPELCQPLFDVLRGTAKGEIHDEYRTL